MILKPRTRRWVYFYSGVSPVCLLSYVAFFGDGPYHRCGSAFCDKIGWHVSIEHVNAAHTLGVVLWDTWIVTLFLAFWGAVYGRLRTGARI